MFSIGYRSNERTMTATKRWELLVPMFQAMGCCIILSKNRNR